MERYIVVAFRMSPGSMAPGPEGTYLTRARALCSRGEALGGALVAWSAAVLAIAWDEESMEEAVFLASSIREDALSPERAWACGIAEGELEALAPDGARMHLAWGEALLAAASLARVARPGEVLVDGDVRALRAGQLSLAGARTSTDGGQRVRGWKLDIAHPWRRALEPPPPPPPPALDATERRVVPPPDSSPSFDPMATQEMPALDFSGVELSTEDVMQIVDAATATLEISVPPPARGGTGPLAERMRRLVRGEGAGEAIETLAELRRARAAAEDAPSAARCQVSLALAVALTFAGRPEEALLEGLDALARGREAHDARAEGACLALLAKLYAGAGRGGEATALREAAGVG